MGWASCPLLSIGGRDAHPTINYWMFFIWKQTLGWIEERNPTYDLLVLRQDILLGYGANINYPAKMKNLRAPNPTYAVEIV